MTLQIKGVTISEITGFGYIPIGKGEQGTVMITCQCELIRESPVRKKKWWGVPDQRSPVWSVVVHRDDGQEEVLLANGSRLLANRRAKALCTELFPKPPVGGRGDMPYPAGYKYLNR